MVVLVTGKRAAIDRVDEIARLQAGGGGRAAGGDFGDFQQAAAGRLQSLAAQRAERERGAVWITAQGGLDRCSEDQCAQG